jgi:hypothetical protein
LLIHRLRSSGADWAWQVAALERNYRVIPWIAVELEKRALAAALGADLDRPPDRPFDLRAFAP